MSLTSLRVLIRPSFDAETEAPCGTSVAQAREALSFWRGRLARLPWYRRAARAEAVPLLDEAAAALGVGWTRLSIRSQRTRWGSCTPDGAISLNWRLLLGPREVFEYVVWHEACHLAVMDHSARFWDLLESRLPDYREPRDWLRRNGAALQL